MGNYSKQNSENRHNYRWKLLRLILESEEKIIRQPAKFSMGWIYYTKRGYEADDVGVTETPLLRLLL